MMKFLMVAVSLLFAACASQPKPAAPPAPAPLPAPVVQPVVAPEPRWSYSGDTAPEHWGDLKEDFAACKTGKAQSPINLKWTNPLAGGGIRFAYQPSHLRVIDNGHTIQVNFDSGSQAEIRGEMYDLKQMHFHSPSEHTLSGRSLPIELHLVHKTPSEKTAALAVFVVEGKSNEFIEKILSIVPPIKDHEMQATEWLISAAELLPKSKTYYQYQGSLTNPPCSEGVNWNVLNTPIEASKEQINRLRALYDHNNRPLQPLNQRKVVNY